MTYAMRYCSECTKPISNNEYFYTAHTGFTCMSCYLKLSGLDEYVKEFNKYTKPTL